MDDLELKPGSGYWLAIEQHGAREIMVEVSEKCFMRHRMLSGGSAYSPDPYYRRDWKIFDNE
jgi:hypothetical protein